MSTASNNPLSACLPKSACQHPATAGAILSKTTVRNTQPTRIEEGARSCATASPSERRLPSW